MSDKLRYFFLGSLGLVVLALVWIGIRGNSESIITEEAPPAASENKIEAKNLAKTKTSEPQASPPASVPTSAPVADSHEKAGMNSEHIYTESKDIIYLDRSPEQKTILNYLNFIGSMKFAPRGEPHFIGVNDQGFDQYEFNARDGSHVKQWKRSGEISVEEVTLENGDKIIRRAPEQDIPVSTVSYEAVESKTYKSVNYRTDGTVQSIYVETNGGGITYYYDQQGRLTGTRTWAPAGKK